ncbi:multiheme c-type cytochrome [Deferribacter desulfuricans SSM1]|uniref:Multiheme c-type cytochrome n=1 Tax=Deferribacter desulfuricans (strain DSM 14783 / JCM 11476 / NBRC 101012 / SSM1) TaxID=639282 RepID=D3PCB5_DEFDS|nr:cytochrome c3 family protein [Deferribacter desulfuricans]BAI80238.1 multiheme c-type cytochrome [Deferribacter desulfuricans SSM1]
MKIRLFLSLFIIIGFSVIIYAGVANTKHNLSKSGPGPIKSSEEDRVCVFCHTPHNALPYAPLWNRELSNALYQTYTSVTMNAQPGQPTGNSKLCLSCHDGTIALNAIYASSTPIANDLNFTLTGDSNLGTDLRDDHPISFVYDDNLANQDRQLKSPSTLPSFIKLQNGRVECTTCHDPHTETVYFLRTGDKQLLCTSCHDKKLEGTVTLSFSSSIHNQVISSAPISADYPCGDCHKPHNAKDVVNGDSTTQLLKGREENLCFICHGSSQGIGPLSQNNIDIENLMSSNDGFYDTYSGTRRWVNRSHDVTDAQQSSSGAHIECINCHGVHGVRRDDLNTTNVIESLVDPDNPSQPFTWGQPTNYSGSDKYWLKVYKIDHFCLKCHDGSFPTFSDRPDLNVLEPSNNNGYIRNIASGFYNSVHGKKRIPCIICHDPHGGNPFLISNRVRWTNAPFDTKNASRSNFDSGDIYVPIPVKFELCRKSCHNGDKQSHQTGKTNCQSCHYHGGGKL